MRATPAGRNVSARAMAYARTCLRSDASLPSNAPTILLLLADSCNHRTGLAFTGTWLAEQAGCAMRHVREHLHRLRDAGYIKVEERVGLASIVTFPTAAYLSTAPDASVRGEHMRAPDAGVTPPLTLASPIPSAHTTDDYKFSNNLEVIAREALCCDGTGYVYDESERTVTPCPLHHPRAHARAAT